MHLKMNQMKNIDYMLHNCNSASSLCNQLITLKMLNPLSIAPFLDTSFKITYPK